MAEHPAAVLARLGMQALTQPDQAAAEYRALAGSSPELFGALDGFARVTDEQLAAFEADNTDLLVRGQFGEIWLCGLEPENFEGEKPWVTARAIRALARAYTEGDAFMQNALGL